MKSANDTERFFKNAAIDTDPAMDEAVLMNVLTAHEKATNTKPAAMQSKIRRTIMKNPISKLAAAAVIIMAVTLGLFEFIDTGSSSGIAWSEVTRQVNSSQGVIVRCIESVQSANENYSIKYLSPTHSRIDTYEGGQLVRSFYSDQNTKTFTGVFHPHKHYLIDTFEESSEGFLEKHEDWMTPGYLIETILSCEHSRLERKNIEGLLCEGIETTDPSFLGPMPESVDHLEAKLLLWVDVKTKYPVLVEYKVSVTHEGKVMGSEGMMDKFQWDVELVPSTFEPTIPPDYQNMRNL